MVSSDEKMILTELIWIATAVGRSRMFLDRVEGSCSMESLIKEVVSDKGGFWLNIGEHWHIIVAPS